MSDNNLADWIGRSEKAEDFLSVSSLSRLASTLGVLPPGSGGQLPLLWYWAFFQPTCPAGELGDDGHPARGGFLPPVTNRNRMWAGSRVEFLHPLYSDKHAHRLSTITDIQEKIGQAGKLLFVTIEHAYYQGEILCVREEQDIVYREPSPPRLATSEPLPPSEWAEEIRPDTTLLFRYSAVTFNSHRIHYDYKYAVEAEGYPELVVHGPLIATLSLQAFCRANPEARVRRFAFRGMRPLLLPSSFVVGGRLQGSESARLWAGNQDGMAQSAEVEFEA
ncbi:MaoC family dehydratase N-terminal domain-containing protein [Pseudomonas sp. BGr12]|uniref:transposase n=1 Tax=Pseudomonas sp. BGr12 TaxID=2936269 RepID=UPI002559DF4C|nr:transposase [Pseudomonas sp. BJa5]MDL2428401.1 transposase [Pseudomonas sp. BJa5]